MSGNHTFKTDPELRRHLIGGAIKVKQERDRAYLLSVFLMVLLVVSILSNLALSNIHTVIPVVTSIDANGHVVKQQIATKETITSISSFVENQVHDFIVACNTFDSSWRQYYADLCRLHSTESVAKQYDQETATDNLNNPYYLIGPNGRRYPKITAINPIEENAYQVEFQSITVKPGSEPKTDYYTALVRNTFTYQPMALGDRWENPLGFAATSYTKNLKLSNK